MVGEANLGRSEIPWWYKISCLSQEAILAGSHEMSVSYHHDEFHCDYEFHIGHEGRYEISVKYRRFVM